MSFSLDWIRRPLFSQAGPRTTNDQSAALDQPVFESEEEHSYESLDETPDPGEAPSSTPIALTEPDVEAQSQLRQEIIKIQQSDMSDKLKAAHMQTLMTKKYLALSNRRDSAITREIGQPLSALDLAKSYNDKAEAILGCQHYRRNCKLECSTCHTIWPCRFCHDESTDHALIRTETKTMLCMLCSTLQDAAQYCKNCAQCMAAYYCDKCKLWDDDPEKPIYHCAKCKICRVGRGIGKDFFHCDKCNVCMAINRQDSHRCIEHSTECDCPICGEYMFSSTQTVVFMNCGHSIHQACYHKHIKTNYRCPTCSKSLRNMDSSFRMLDHQIAQQRMPAPYSLWKAKILCNDCQSRSTVRYHFLGHKCDNCLSYNVAIDKVIKDGNEGDGVSTGAETLEVVGED